MDYLDHKKHARHRLIILFGYLCIAVAIVIATLVLLYQAYGFGIGKNGKLIQNSLTFFSSQPNPARIYVNGSLNKLQTNTRLVLPEGMYHIKLVRDGYRNWERTIELDGGAVEHFDYPLLVPSMLKTKQLANYAALPALSTQSPDRRWLVVSHTDDMASFDIYDLKSPTKAPVVVTLPANLLSKAVSTEGWQLGEWSDDNQHILLRHLYDGKIEYVLADRTAPVLSLNLNAVLPVNPPQLTLKNKKYDQYYIYDQAAATLKTLTLKTPVLTPVLDHVLAFKAYGDNTLLYATDSGAGEGKILIKLATGDHTDIVRSFPAGGAYLLDLAKYNNTLYVVAGASNLDKVYIYKDPAGQLNNLPKQAPSPSQVLHLSAPNYISFSTSAQYIMAENGQEFGVYDIQSKNGYKYTASQPLDAPQTHAAWMDGNRLTYTSGGKVQIFDYDNTNHQTLVSDNSAYLPAFAPNYKFIYALVPSTATPGQVSLSQTSLLIPADQ